MQQDIDTNELHISPGKPDPTEYIAFRIKNNAVLIPIKVFA